MLQGLHREYTTVETANCVGYMLELTPYTIVEIIRNTRVIVIINSPLSNLNLQKGHNRLLEKEIGIIIVR